MERKRNGERERWEMGEDESSWEERKGSSRGETDRQTDREYARKREFK